MFKKVVSFVFSKPATAGYPYIKPQLYDNFRGQMKLDCTLCVGCGLCSKDCPTKAIEMVAYYNGKKRPQFNLSKCVFCYQCAESCPQKAIKNTTIFELATTDKANLTLKPLHVIVCQA